MKQQTEPLPTAVKSNDPILSEEEWFASYSLIYDGRYRWRRRQAEKPLTFRGEPIEWTERKKTIITAEAAFGEDETKEKTFHFIRYQGQEYKPEEFLKAMFPYYKDYPYKVEFKSDDIFRLGSSQRAKLSYDILSEHFRISGVSPQDDEDLADLAYHGNCETAKNWLKRISWFQSSAQMLHFGCNLNVAGHAKGVWCYSTKRESNKVIFSGQEMTWENWAAPLIDYVRYVRLGLKASRKTEPAEIIEDCIIQAKANAMGLLFNHYGWMITLPQRQYYALQKWVSDSFEREIPFPYCGDTGSDTYSFSINIGEGSSDYEIVPSDNRGETMSKYNAEHNAERNKAQGLKETLERFAPLSGDAWTRQEILAQGFTQSNLDTFLKHGLIRRVSQGHYVRNSV